MTEPPTATMSGEGPLAIVCGGGSLPLAVADAVKRSGRRVVLFPFRGWADRAAVESYPHHWIAVGQFGRLRRLARGEGCRDVVLIGTLVRPSLRSIRLDWTTLRLMPRLLRAFRGGDDHLLSEVARIFEDSGFRVVGAHSVAPEILVSVGPLGANRPSARDHSDIARALDLLSTIGRFDVGQAVVVAEGHVLAIEAAEGTDRMLKRIADLRKEGHIHAPTGVGVLVKAPKPQQDQRVDLPAIGPATVEGVARAGLAGLAVVAGSAIVAEPEEVVRRADAAKIFVAGVPHATSP